MRQFAVLKLPYERAMQRLGDRIEELGLEGFLDVRNNEEISMDSFVGEHYRISTQGSLVGRHMDSELFFESVRW